jgi:hypothetical protein
MNKYEINYYIVFLSGFNPTIIRLKKVSSLKYVCFFTNSDYINQFDTLGFQVEINDDIVSFKNMGNAPLEFLLNVWDQIYSKINSPDYVVKIENIEEDFNDHMI